MLGLEEEADDDIGPLIGPVQVQAVLAPPANAVPAEAPRRHERLVVSKNRTDIVVSANGDEWVKHKMSDNGTKQYWRCREHHTCAVRGVSDFGSTVVTRTKLDAVHTHDLSPATHMARNMQAAVRSKAIEDRDSSNAAIVDNVTRGMPDAVAQRIKRVNLLRIANKAKRGFGADLVNRPAEEIEFTEAFSTTAAGEEFLLFDSRRTEPEQPPILIFASATGVQMLRQSRDWGSDGTFHVAPPQFDSLYTVHAMRDDHSAVCAAYMLLPDRTADTYIRAMRALIREAHLDDAAPASIMTDFEAAAITAWRTIFPNAHMRGCLFHFSQALWRNIAAKGLTLLYRGNNKARDLLRCFAAMAFVHPNDALEAYDCIVAALRTCLNAGEIDAAFEDGLNSFCDYVRDNYLRRLDRQGRWQSPRVANVHQWNCHYAALQGFHRTNNTIEAWNRQFGEMFAKAHCAMDKFIYRMQTDEDRTRQAVQRQALYPNEPLRRGRRPQNIATDAALRSLVERYDDYRGAGRLLEFMRAVQHHLCKARFPGEAPVDDEDDNGDAGQAGQDDQAHEPPVDAPVLAPGLPGVAPPMPAVNQPVQAQPVRAQAVVAQRVRAQAAVAQPVRAQAAVAQPVRAQAAVAQPVRAQAAVAQPVRAQAAVAQPGRAEAPPDAPIAAARAVAQTPLRNAVANLAPATFTLPRRYSMEARCSANNEPSAVQGNASGAAAAQDPGPSQSATPLRTLAAAAREQLNASIQERCGATAGPSNSRKRTAAVAQLLGPPKSQAVRREEAQAEGLQEEDVQLPSQLSQNGAAVQALSAIDNIAGSVAGRRAGRGSRMAAIIQRLS